MAKAEQIPITFPEVGQHLILDDISQELERTRQAAAEDDIALTAPVLALGISERVGSNWFLDTLAQSMQAHNEPFRQQLHGSHPLSTISPRPLDVSTYPVSVMHPYERYWLSNFVISKHTPQPQIIKETNLFFANENFTRLFPDSKAIVLARNPIGIASSFADNDLFKRWNYAERYNQLKAMTRQPQYEQYGFVFDGDHDPGTLRKLTRLIVLNTLLISEAAEGMDTMVVRYEDTVTDKQAAFINAAQFITGNTDMDPITIEHPEVDTSDHVFSTRKNKTELVANLDEDDVRTIRNEVRRLLADSLTMLTEEAYTEVQNVLEPLTDKYVTKGRKPLSSTSSVEASTVDFEVPAFEYIQDPNQATRWGNQLVPNRDFVEFMNEMHNEGIPNVINGTQLFANENMIPARGGRIWFNPNKGDYEVTPDYEDYPAYWVTWLGAAAFARFRGARLPNFEEVDTLVASVGEIDFASVNCDHRFDDVTPSGLITPTENGIHDVVGNLAVWCADGFTETKGHGASRYMHGTAWNRDGNQEELRKAKSRPLSGSSRSVGIRLAESNKASLTAPELARRFEGWFTLLSGPIDRAKADRYIIDQLTL